jgi:hypothetical protein
MWTMFCRSCGALSIGILLVLGPVAQAGAAQVADFRDIQASPISITPDPGGRSAVLEVTTSIDVACSVVYGPDESFGLLAVDSDMGGGAHAEHQPVMGGLEPDTEYRYRVQGTAPDGSMYVSEVMSFRTPPEPEGGPVNLALEAVSISASSEFSDAFSAVKAFDGDSATEWSSRGDGDDAWIEIDLGAPREVGEVLLRTRSMSDGSAIIGTYSITADGVDAGTFPADALVGVDLEARILRFDVVSSSGGNTGAVEILVLEREAGAP